jgi:hypothetical protein
MGVRGPPASYSVTRDALLVDRFSRKRHREDSMRVRRRLRTVMQHDFVLGGEDILSRLAVTI